MSFSKLSLNLNMIDKAEGPTFHHEVKHDSHGHACLFVSIALPKALLTAITTNGPHPIRGEINTETAVSNTAFRASTSTEAEHSDAQARHELAVNDRDAFHEALHNIEDDMSFSPKQITINSTDYLRREHLTNQPRFESMVCHTDDHTNDTLNMEDDVDNVIAGDNDTAFAGTWAQQSEGVAGCGGRAVDNAGGHHHLPEPLV